ncbi:BF3164 family lipoprotein [Proteiniphilum saccharofermentans]|uniref:BF3164 family lipoprotein n=1 Tax=Proteiniphilum saccharofermentans TaxID=1642647 RepID=UPI0028AF2610|nr:BF3164 family lipoprotein [Proteiniphilum saccharofermentans]
MKKKIIYRYLMLAYFLICINGGCNNINERVYYDSFTTSISLSGKTLEIDSVMLRYPFRIEHKDSLAIIMDLHHPDYFYHAFTYPLFEPLSSFGKRGQAPEEILSAENFRLTDNGMWGLDANKHLLTKISVGNIAQSANEKETPLDKEIIRALDFALYDDSCFVIPDYSGKHRFHIIDKNGNIRSSHGKIPSRKHKKGDIALAQAWRSFIDYNPENHTLAMVTQLGEVLEIYNLKDSTHIVKIGPHGEPEYNESGGMAIPSGIMGFSDVQVTDKYIYTVFHGRSFKEIAQQPQPMIDGGQYIYVFSLEGDPLYKYTLDHFIYGIDVNERTREIYAVDVNSNQPVVKYELKH